jgi:hypothetical protein
MTFAILLLLVMLLPATTHGEPSRLTGRTTSIAPAEGVVLIEDLGDDDLTAVDFRAAQVVRVWRDRLEIPRADRP